MSPTQTIITLRELVETQGRYTERECADQLSTIAGVLLSAADGHNIFVRTEQRCSTGRVDVVVFADALQPGGESRRQAHIWELKAPQHQLFELRTQSQAHPSAELYDAETQLLHYCYSVRNDGTLLRRWEILSPDHVKLGGVIIGRDSNIIACQEQNGGLVRQLALEAFNIREVHFYEPARMKVWTWDKVIAIAEDLTEGHQMRINDPSTSIDLTRTVDLSARLVAEQPEETNE